MTGRAEQTEPLGRLLMPILLGLVADIVVKTITGLPMPWRALVIVILGIFYGAFELARRRPGQIAISRRTANLMTIALVVAIILIGAGALILALGLVAVIFLIGWLILMIIFIRVARSLPVTSVVPKSILMGVAMVSLGAALSMGGGPVVEFVTGGPVRRLVIHNNCSIPFAVPALNIDVPANGSQTMPVPAVSVTIRREQEKICVGTTLEEYCFYSYDADITLNGQPIRSGDSLSINLQEQEEHSLVITCR